MKAPARGFDNACTPWQTASDSHPRAWKEAMPKDEWGLKRVCPTCATRFYDLQRDPMTCPACGATFSLESLLAGKPRPARVEKAKPEAADIGDDADIETDDEVIDGGDDLEDDILEDEEDNVDLDEIADVAADDEES
jgi:uncharacterized protein (TIGR02300 family)